MANPDIGTITCPCCDYSGAHVRQTVKKKVYIVCDECSSQTFARGSVSDASIRRRMKPVAVQPDPSPAEPPAPKPKKKTAAAVPPAPAPEPKEKEFGSWLNL